MKKLLILLAALLSFYGCAPEAIASSNSASIPASSSASVPENKDFIIEGNKTIYSDAFMPGYVTSFLWLDDENLLLNEGIQRGDEISTAFHKFNVVTNTITTYEGEYPDTYVTIFDSVKFADGYKLVDYAGNVIILNNDNTWQMDNEVKQETNLSARWDLDTETTFEYNYETEYLMLKQGETVENLIRVPLQDKRFEYIAAITLSQDKNNLAFAVMKEAESTKIITLDLTTKQEQIYNLSLPVPGIIWLDNQLILINFNGGEAGTLAQLVGGGIIIDEIKLAKQDGNENIVYSNVAEGSGIANGKLPFFTSDRKTGVLYMLTINNNKLQVEKIEDMLNHTGYPMFSPNGEYLAYYYIDTVAQISQFVVQKYK